MSQHLEGQNQPLYKAREPIFPRKVKGFYRRLKWWIMAFTLGVYYLTPWIRFDRGPHLPDQAVLVDLQNRRFFMFWIEIWPHELYFVAGLLIMAGIGLFLFTSALGRVWCGYACPQTVWTDLFILVERWIDGDRNARIRLWNRRWDSVKIRKRAVKWSLWLLISLATGGAWVFYFTDAPQLAKALFSGTAPPIAWITISILTFTTFILGGFMREQVCIYMCPWPRIQSAMMDEDTLTVGYRFWRGEPRSKHQKALARDAKNDQSAAKSDASFGDCIDCMACVNVCPVGIDIRDGQQLECITCALCIDACDDVMAKIGKPRGLIDYLALCDEEAEKQGAKPRSPLHHILRPRTILYSVLWASIGFLMLYALFIRAEFEMLIAPVRSPTYVTLSDGSVRNIYEVRLRNKTAETVPVTLGALADNQPINLSYSLGDESLSILPDSTLRKRIYLTVPADSQLAQSPSTPIRFWMKTADGAQIFAKQTYFNGALP